MFDFFKRRIKTPKPIFEALGTDMHCHLIPRVDDGSKGIDETISCLETLQSVGYKSVYITPHFQYPRFPNTEADICARFDEVKAAAEKIEGLDIKLSGIAGEYRLDNDFMVRNEGRQFLTFGDNTHMDKGYMLVEFSLNQRTIDFEEMIRDLQHQGYVVVLAHPERYPYFNVNGVDLAHLKNMDVLFQLNVLSLDGFYGEEPMHKAYQMIDRGWVEMLGTDTHNALYCQALVNASNNRRIEKILNKNNFLNIEL